MGAGALVVVGLQAVLAVVVVGLQRDRGELLAVEVGVFVLTEWAVCGGGGLFPGWCIGFCCFWQSCGGACVCVCEASWRMVRVVQRWWCRGW